MSASKRNIYSIFKEIGEVNFENQLEKFQLFFVHVFFAKEAKKARVLNARINYPALCKELDISDYEEVKCLSDGRKFLCDNLDWAPYMLNSSRDTESAIVQYSVGNTVDLKYIMNLMYKDRFFRTAQEIKTKKHLLQVLWTLQDAQYKEFVDMKWDSSEKG
ncbi:hypothetical protein ACFL08_00570 [Patescibacteria group bacterium]